MSLRALSPAPMRGRLLASGDTSQIKKGTPPSSRTASPIRMPSRSNPSCPKMSRQHLSCTCAGSMDQEMATEHAARVRRTPSQANVTDWAHGYLGLLADASSNPGGIKDHLAKLTAKGVDDSVKAYMLATNPANFVQDMLSDRGADHMLEKYMAVKRQAAVSHGSEPPKESPVASAVHSKALSFLMSAAITAAGSGIQATAAEAFAGLSAQQTEISVQHEHKQQTTPLAMFVMPAAPALVGESTMRQEPSLRMPSGALTVNTAATTTHTTAATTFANTAATNTDDAASAMAKAMQRAPTLMPQSAFADAAGMAGRQAQAATDDIIQAVTGVGGMAASTAMRLLRADSKAPTVCALDKAPSFGTATLGTLQQAFDSLLGSWDEGDEVGGHHRGAHRRAKGKEADASGGADAVGSASAAPADAATVEVRRLPSGAVASAAAGTGSQAKQSLEAARSVQMDSQPSFAFAQA